MGKNIKFHSDSFREGKRLLSTPAEQGNPTIALFRVIFIRYGIRFSRLKQVQKWILRSSDRDRDTSLRFRYGHL